MKNKLFLGALAATVIVLAASAAVYQNKFVANANPEGIGWTNTVGVMVNGPFWLPNAVGAGNTSYDAIKLGVGKTNAFRWRTGFLSFNGAVELDDGTEGTYGSTNNLRPIHALFYGFHYGDGGGLTGVVASAGPFIINTNGSGTNLNIWSSLTLNSGQFNGNGAGVTNLPATAVNNATNATTANIGTPAMADGFVEFSTNGVLNITGIVKNPAAPAGSVQYWRGIVTNTLGSVSTYTIASSFISAQGGTLFNTNLATITIEYWPGFCTNFIFQCIR